MYEFEDLDDWLTRRLKTRQSSSQYENVDDWLKRRLSKYQLLDEWEAERAAQRPQKELSEDEGILGLLEQFGRGALKNATFGISKYYLPEEEPSGTAESIARGAGSLAGFMVPIIGVGGPIAKAGFKALGLVPKALEAGKVATSAQRTLAAVSHMAKSASTLGIAEAVSDVTDPSTMLQRAAHGAKIGAIFGAAGFGHINGHPFLSWMVRQFGGRTLMAAGGEYKDIKEMGDPRNLATTIFNEALMTYFLSKGITTDDILKPERLDMTRRQAYDNAMNTIFKFKAETTPGSDFKIGKEHFETPQKGTMNVSDLIGDNKLTPKSVESIRERIRQGITSEKTMAEEPITVDYDATTGKYIAAGKSDFLEALRLANLDRALDGQPAIVNIPVLMRSTRVGQPPNELGDAFKLVELFNKRQEKIIDLEHEEGDFSPRGLGDTSTGPMTMPQGVRTKVKEAPKLTEVEQPLEWDSKTRAYKRLPLLSRKEWEARATDKYSLPAIELPGGEIFMGKTKFESHEEILSRAVAAGKVTYEGLVQAYGASTVTPNKPYLSGLRTISGLVYNKQFFKVRELDVGYENYVKRFKATKGATKPVDSNAPAGRPKMTSTLVPTEKDVFVDTATIQRIMATRYFAYNVDTGYLRPLELRVIPSQTLLKPREILFERGDMKPSGDINVSPINRGRLVKPFKFGEKDIRFPDKFEESLDKFLKLKTELEEQIQAKAEQHDSATMLRRQLAKVDNSIIHIQDYLGTKNAKRDAYFAKAKIKTTDIGAINTKVTGMVNRFYKAFDDPIPTSFLDIIETRLYQTKSGINLNHVLNTLELKGKLRIRDLGLVEDMVLAIEEAPQGAKIGVLTSRILQKMGFVRRELVGETALQQARDDKITNKMRSREVLTAWGRAQSIKDIGNPIQQLLTLSRKWFWADMLKVADYIQTRSGIPMYEIVRRALEGHSRKKFLLDDITGQLNKFRDMSSEEQAGIGKYYAYMFEESDVSTIPLNKMQHDFIDTVDNIMAHLKPFVAEARHQMWMQEVREKRDNVLHPLPDERVIFKKQRQYEKILQDGAEQYGITEMAKLSGSTNEMELGAYDMWLQGPGSILGGIYDGAYLPTFVLDAGKVKFDYNQEGSEVGSIGKGHIKIKGKQAAAYENQKLEESLQTAFLDKNLSSRLYGYFNQILNLKYINPAIRALEDLVNVFPEEFLNAKPRGIGRTTAEAKTMSLHDYMEVWAHRLKGYPVKLGGIAEFMRQTQSIFFRALTPRPFLWLRNLPQVLVTQPHKMNLLDPRTVFTKFKELSPNLQKWFQELGVNMEAALRNDFLQLASTERFRDKPFIGMWFSLAEKVGNVYTLTDIWSRKVTYSRTAARALMLLGKHKRGELSLEQVENGLGIHIMETSARRWWRDAVRSGDSERAAFEIAKWQTDNSQWVYRRVEKSLIEQTSEGEAWTNLLTWGKSISQQSLFAFERTYNGAKAFIEAGTGAERMAAGRLMMGGAAQIASLMIAGAVANKALETVSGAYKSRFSAYGTDMFTWEFGGVTTEIITSWTSALSELVGSLDKPPEDRQKAMDTVLKMIDNVAIRQLLPFTKNALAAIESITGRSYLSPVYEKVNQVTKGYTPGETYVQRTMLEGIAHAITAADPSKQESVRKWVNRKKHELQIKVAAGARFKEYYKLMLQHYERLDAMLQRYTPMQLYKNKMARERQKWYDSLSGKDSFYNDMYKMEKDYSQMKRYGQYYEQ